jgi:hypothetical protein
MGISSNRAAINISQTPFLNINCFADPGSRCQATAPRYFSGLRTDGIHNVDLSIYKEFSPKESMKLQVRADIFNLVNHPRSRAARFFLGSWRHPVWHHQFHRGRIHSAQNAIWAQIRILIRKPEEIQDEPKLPAVGFRALPVLISHHHAPVGIKKFGLGIPPHSRGPSNYFEAGANSGCDSRWNDR